MQKDPPRTPPQKSYDSHLLSREQPLRPMPAQSGGGLPVGRPTALSIDESICNSYQPNIMKQAYRRAEPYVSTTNACKLCKPLGACLAFRGIEGAVPFLHGSQGCATYMRRYIISHFREPVDIASSSLGEKHAIYGGGPNLKLGLRT